MNLAHHRVLQGRAKMASVPVYCLCQLPYDVTCFMIERDMCQDWFHGSCVGVEEEKAADIDLYHCPNSHWKSTTVEFLEENSFSVPILVLKKDGLGMTLHSPSFTVRDVEHYVGSDKEIHVIDVTLQADCKMKFGDFVKYYYNGKREKVLNVISLEFSDTGLSNLVETPKIVRKLSWVENLWPEECL
ncbi:PHD finger protein 8 [Saguinus oedipus]|uniref:PHD finger protein 8 n=1 Tax=Saguinus oedipus TaxID=9490 RepID=A0ABQ9W9D6_SAGOE|nr:PHD finger protein 8 [Saguinus oedipus]